MSGRFAHYSFTKAAMVARYCARGKRATDEMLLEAFRQIDPPLLSERDARAVAHILARTRGRPPRPMPSGHQLARKLKHCRRKDIPAPYVEQLRRRLSTRKGLSENERGAKAWKKINKLQRDNLIRFLYPQFRDLQSDRDFIEHPILGRMLIPMKISSRSERALWLVREVMDKRLGYDPPGEGTIRNIISKNF